ncbi:serine ammonia-lyase [Brevibacillus choshinensis]|uniref:Probable D-serine dehydratase n=1 Tax=Brevibacillus choshinensis TaxID=54911 RepID=A0ABR5NDM5_BRECH|nr:D-serine ammonia-lyase [Brevibacillus choshinensis]KQL49665.1 serine ammonia-lyase [Brevibacillus choshinensis]
MNKEQYVAGKSIDQWIEDFPVIDDMVSTKEVVWINPNYDVSKSVSNSLGKHDVFDAEKRLNRFAPYLAKVFPETKAMNGMIESPIVPIRTMQGYLEKRYNREIPGELWMKCDSHLPIAGSIKARGGIYEVLQHAEDLALRHGKLTIHDNYELFDSESFRDFFSQYSIAVGSTGNLGLSIGIMSAKIGFNVTVHMSADAKQWKKDLLRSRGVNVIEYASDYSKAVEEGRKQAENDPNCYFIDDENSKHLFLGYAVAAKRLQKQLDENKIIVDQEHPLFVYLPCGVGGGPGGVAFGLKLLFQDHVHCFFAEPTHSPCMLLGLLTGLHDQVCVQDFGIDNKTEADGLAVGRPSRFVGKTVESLLSGVYTIEDDELYVLLQALSDTEKINLEPSALAGMLGPVKLTGSEQGKQFFETYGLEPKLKQGTHIVWATGGNMVPAEIMDEYYQRGLSVTQKNI